MDITNFLVEEAAGLIGGAVFFGSWLLQAWESRKAGQAVVTKTFFTLRALASALLTFEGVRVGSVSISLMMGATLVLMLYNIHLIRSREKQAAQDQTS